MRLLIAEDEEYTREGIIERLNLAGLGISALESAEDGADALKKAARFMPDIVLTDVRMPHLDGVAMVLRLREANPQIKVIFMSGYADKVYLKAAIEIGALRYVEKPVDVEEIEHAIRTAVEHLRAERAKTALNGATAALAESELARLLAGGPADAGSVAALASSAGLSLATNTRGITVMFRIGLGGRRAADGSQEIDDFCSYLRTRLVRSHFYALVSPRPWRIIVAHLLARPGGEHLLTHANLAQLVGRLVSSGDAPLPATAGIGDAATDLRGLAASAASAASALDLAFFGPFGRVTLSPADAVDEGAGGEGAVSEYARYLEAGNLAGALSVIRGAVEKMCSSPFPSVAGARTLFRKLLLRLMLFRDEVGFGMRPGSEQEELWRSVESGGTAGETADLVSRETTLVFERLGEVRQEGRLVAEVKRYILENYSDPGTCVESIARAVDLSPAYLCTRFKSRTGTTINRFLTNVRLTRAKEMLADPRGPKISEISARVGWIDADYFARVFRKATARSPSEFRERRSQ